MIQATVESEVTLTMDMGKAKWLKAAMQNPLHASNPENENSTDKDNRIELFDALEQVCPPGS